MSEKKGGHKWLWYVGAAVGVIIVGIEAGNAYEALTNGNNDIPVPTNENTPKALTPADVIATRSTYLDAVVPELLSMKTKIIPVKQGKAVTDTRIASLHTELIFANFADRTVALFRAATDVSDEGIILAAPVDSSLANQTIAALQQGKTVDISLQGEYVRAHTTDDTGAVKDQYAVLYINKAQTTEHIEQAKALRSGIQRRLAVGGMTAAYMTNQTPHNRRTMMEKTGMLFAANYFPRGRRR